MSKDELDVFKKKRIECWYNVSGEGKKGEMKRIAAENKSRVGRVCVMEEVDIRHYQVEEGGIRWN